MNIQIIAAGVVGFVFVVSLLLAFAWRTVVDTNKVHIVQSGKKTVSYGANLNDGNVYYAIPPWVPAWGVSVIDLPVNNFALDLNDYKAYDKDRVPFELHVTAFFRIADTNIAAARVQSFEQLNAQLEAVVKGAVRKILASHDIHGIMTARSTFGEQFTAEVATELQSWGVVPVKNMELMDIRDTAESKVISNIMAKKSSHIEMESRTEVALNKQKAETAEIEAKRAINLSSIEAERTTKLSAIEATQAVGERTVEQEKAVGVAKERATQEVKIQAATTMEKEMQIVSVSTQRKAEIVKAAGIVKAEEDAAVAMKEAEGKANALALEARGKATAVTTEAEAKLKQTQLEADGRLALYQRDAEGARVAGQAKADAEAAMAEAVRANGQAKAAAELAMAEAVKAMQLAPVEAQITLAKEIGSNANYQHYLVTVRQVEAAQAVGIAQADALKAADIKVFANTGDAPSGLTSVGDLLGSKGGVKLGAFLEGLKSTPEGEKVIAKATGNGARA